MITNLVPLDLSDDINLRRYLQNSVEVQQTQNTLALAQSVRDELYTPSRIETDSEIYVYVDAQINATNEAISDVQDEVTANFNTLTSADSTLDTKINTVETTINGNVSSLETTVSNNYTYLNNKTIAIENDLTSNYATVSYVSGVYATQTSVGAIYGIEVNANGHISGYKSIATGDTSLFQIYAEYFAVSDSGTDEGYNVFTIDTANEKVNFTADVAIDGNLFISGTVASNALVTNTITADKIAANTITSNEIAANTITASEIAAGTITTNELTTIGIAYFTNDAGYTDDSAVTTLAGTLGDLAVKDVIGTALLDTTVIVGGYLKTTLLDANYIKSDIINATYLNAQSIVAGSVAAENITGTTISGKTITGSTINASNFNILDADDNIIASAYSATFFTLWDTTPDLFYLKAKLVTTGSGPFKMIQNKSFLSLTQTDISWTIYGPYNLGYLWLFSCDDSSIEVVIKDGTTTRGSTTISANGAKTLLGFNFYRIYDTGYTNKYHYYIAENHKPNVLLNNSLEISLHNTDGSFAFLNTSIQGQVSNL